MRKYYRRYLFPLCSLAALFIGMLGIRFVFAQGPSQGVSPQKAALLTCGTWSVVASPNVGSSHNYLNGVAAISASNVWAVGNYASSGFDRTLIEHWNGTSWSVVPSPNVGPNNYLYGVAAVSASNVWAVGNYIGSGFDQTLIEHWNGTSWSVVPSPNVGPNYTYLSGVAAVSASNVWAVGNYFNSSSSRTLIEFHC